MEKKEEIKKVEEPKKEQPKQDKEKVVDNSKELQELREKIQQLEEAQRNAVVETVPGFVVGSNTDDVTDKFSWDELREKARQEALEDREMIVRGAYFNEPGTDFEANPMEWTEIAMLNLYKRHQKEIDEIDPGFWKAIENCNYREALKLAIQDKDNMDKVSKHLTNQGSPYNYTQQHAKLKKEYENIFRNDAYNPNSTYNLFRNYQNQIRLSRLYGK